MSQGLLGFISPFILKGRQVLQQTCVESLEWDQPISDDLLVIWEKWLTELKQLQNITIPRCYTPKGFSVPIVQEIHHFSDASEVGFGTCSYLRVVGQNHKVHCSLIMSKSRVAPKKKVTIPRLELQAAVLSAKSALCSLLGSAHGQQGALEGECFQLLGPPLSCTLEAAASSPPVASHDSAVLLIAVL